MAKAPSGLPTAAVTTTPPLNSVSQYPANTMPALEDALVQGFDGFEIDVRLARDGQFVLAHDGDLSIATTCKGWIAKYTAAELKSKCHVVASQTTGLESVAAPKAAPMPSLVEVLRRYARDRRVRHFMIDIKPNRTLPLIWALSRAMKALSPAEQEAVARKAIVMPPDEHVTEAMQRALPGLSYALEVQQTAGDDKTICRHVPETCQEARPRDVPICKYNSLYFGPGTAELRIKINSLAKFVERSQRHKRPVIAWGVNSHESAQLILKKVPELDFAMTDMRHSDIPK